MLGMTRPSRLTGWRSSSSAGRFQARRSGEGGHLPPAARQSSQRQWQKSRPPRQQRRSLRPRLNLRRRRPGSWPARALPRRSGGVRDLGQMDAERGELRLDGPSLPETCHSQLACGLQATPCSSSEPCRPLSSVCFGIAPRLPCVRPPLHRWLGPTCLAKLAFWSLPDQWSAQRVQEVHNLQHPNRGSRQAKFSPRARRRLVEKGIHRERFLTSPASGLCFKTRF